MLMDKDLQGPEGLCIKRPITREVRFGMLLLTSSKFPIHCLRHNQDIAPDKDALFPI